MSDADARSAEESTNELIANLLWQFNRVAKQRDDVDWGRFLNECPDSESRSRLCAAMIRCESELCGWNAEAIRARLKSYAIYISTEMKAAAIRSIYVDRLEAGDRPRLDEFNDFDLGYDVLQLRSDEESMYLGQEIVGRYRVEECLGIGGFGVVYRAMDLAQQRLVVIKAVRVADAEKEQMAAEMLRREADIVAKLKYPGLPQVIGYVVNTDNRPCLIFEFVEGGTLQALKKKGPIAPERAARIVARIADTLQFVHRNGLMHRDLSASNILLDENDIPMLLDFGLAASPDERVDEDVVIGTAGYISPGSATGNAGPLDVRHDIWALGVVLYELLTPPSGRKASGKYLALDAAMIFLDELSRPNPDIPPKLQSICKKCVATNPMDGYETAGMLARDLRAFLGDQLPSLDAKVEMAQFRLFAWRVGTKFGLAWGNHAYARSYWQRTSVPGNEEPYYKFRVRIVLQCESSMLQNLRSCVEDARRTGAAVSVAESDLDCREARNGPSPLIPDVELWIPQFLDKVERELKSVCIQLGSHFGADGQDGSALFNLAALLASCCTGVTLRETLERLANEATLFTSYLERYMELTPEGSWLDLRDESKRVYKNIEWELTNRLADEMESLC